MVRLGADMAFHKSVVDCVLINDLAFVYSRNAVAMTMMAGAAVALSPCDAA